MKQNEAFQIIFNFMAVESYPSGFYCKLKTVGTWFPLVPWAFNINEGLELMGCWASFIYFMTIIKGYWGALLEWEMGVLLIVNLGDKIKAIERVEDISSRRI